MTVVIRTMDGKAYSVGSMERDIHVGVADGDGPNSVGVELRKGEPCIVMWPQSDEPRHIPLRLVRFIENVETNAA